MISTGCFGCSAEWTLPSGYILTCISDSDCPGDQTCNGDTGSCVDPSQPLCGNGQVEYGEDCDIGSEATQACDYGDRECVVCIGLDFETLADKAIDELLPCRYRKIRGAWCGDGVVQQRGLIDGINLYHEEDNGLNTGEWEACDSEQPVTCASLHEGLGNGMATCVTKNHESASLDSSLDCMVFDTSQCENQSAAFVPAGPFMMGCNAAEDADCVELFEGPYHQVYLDGFLMDTLEVTAGQYQACVDAGVCVYDGTTTDELRNYNNDRDDHPMNFVDWEAAQTYCEYRGKRLPTEAQWEKAARGTDGRLYPWGREAPSCERTIMPGYYEINDGQWRYDNGCGLGHTWPVGSREAASPYGLKDMLGNVREWVSDMYYPMGYYDVPEQGWVNPELTGTGTRNVIRGGSWIYNKSFNFRTSFREGFTKEDEDLAIGFRCIQ